MSSRSIDALANFSHLLVTKASSDDVKDLLVAAARDATGAAAAVFVDVDALGGAHVTASHGYDARPALPAPALWDARAGDALGSALTTAATPALATADRFDLVVDGERTGALVLLFASHAAAGRVVDDEGRRVARALADIAALALARGEVRSASMHAEKLRALGGMAAGISHDLKNVFGPLLMQLDVLARKDDADVGFLKERLEKMRRPLERGLLIVERLRSFSKRSASDEREVVDLHTVVDDAIGICRPKTVGTDVEIALEPGHAPLVRIDVAQMVAALTNVFIHAIESVAGAANGKLSVRIGARDGGAVVDVVTSGALVQAGQGFGGIRELARRHGGTVEVGGTKTGGARVSLWLPGADDERAGVPHA